MADNPIEHVVIIFKENHTVDNYFGLFPGVDGLSSPLAAATLAAAGQTWRCYADPQTSFMANIAGLEQSPQIVASAQFDSDLASATFPSVSWLYPPDGLSEHPGDWHEGPVLPPGVAWTTERVAAAAASAWWPTMVIF